MDFSRSLSCPGILQQFSGIAGRMPHIGDEEIAALHHVSVCADDGKPFGDRFQIRRIEQGVERLWQIHLSVGWVIWGHQHQCNIRVRSLNLRQRPDHQTVEISILPHHKFRYAIFHDMALYGFKQGWAHPIRCLPMPYKKAASHLTALIHSRSHILLIVIHNRNIKLLPILIIISLIIRCVKRKLMI